MRWYGMKSWLLAFQSRWPLHTASRESYDEFSSWGVLVMSSRFSSSCGDDRYIKMADHRYEQYGSSRPYGYARLVTSGSESVTITKSSFLMVIRRNSLKRPVLTDKVVMVTFCFPPIRSKVWLLLTRDHQYSSRYGFDPVIALAIEGRHYSIISSSKEW